MHTRCDGEQSQSIAAAHSDIGSALLGLERYDEALRHFRRAMSIDEAILGESHPTLARRWTNLGVGHYKTGDLTSAVHCYTKAMVIDRSTLGDKHPAMAAKWNNLGLAWKQMGEFDLALSAFTQALDIDGNADDPAAFATTLYNLGITW